MKIIELHYLKDNEGHLELDLNEQRYLIDFHTMTQTNLMSKRQRDIRRRPYDSKELQRIKEEKLMKEIEMQRIAELEEAKRLQRIEYENFRRKIEIQRKADLEEAKRLQRIEGDKLRRAIEIQRKADLEAAKRLQRIEDEEFTRKQESTTSITTAQTSLASSSSYSTGLPTQEAVQPAPVKSSCVLQ